MTVTDQAVIIANPVWYSIRTVPYGFRKNEQAKRVKWSVICTNYLHQRYFPIFSVGIHGGGIKTIIM